MKISIFLITLLILPSAEWLTNFEQAQHEARAQNKLILLNFSGSDWCAPCIKMKQDVFDQATFMEYAAQNLILVRADFPRNKKHQLEAEQKTHNERLAEKYNPEGKFPLTLLLNPAGKVLFTWDGYNNKPVAEFIHEIDKVHGK